MPQMLIVEDHTLKPTDEAQAQRWKPTTFHAAQFGPGLLCTRARQSVMVYGDGAPRSVQPVLIWRNGAPHEVTCSDCRDWRPAQAGGIQNAEAYA